MFTKCYGYGERVYVGLHGWSGDHTTFAPLERYLPDDARLCSLDLPGCGQSPPPVEWKLESIAEEIASEIIALGADRITIVGNCSGALLALMVLPQVTNRVERLVLIDPFAFAPWYFRIFLTPGWGRYAYYATFANPIGRWLTNASLKRRRVEDSHLTSSFQSVNHETTYRYLELLVGMGSVNQFADIRQPIDLVYGARTFGAVKQSIEQWRSLWPRARVWELERAGHLPIEEATEALAEILFTR